MWYTQICDVLLQWHLLEAHVTILHSLMTQAERYGFYFLKLKSDVFEVFKKWKVMVETNSNLKLKCLRSDNGGEYEDGSFKQFYAVNRIRMEKTILGTPQQNGVAECMNRTLNKRPRSMRLYAGLSKTLWVDAVSTTGYLINRGPSVPLGHKLPEEVWSGKEVNLSHLKVFGCVSYVYIDSDTHSKLDVKSRKCYFIGYGDEAFGYRFWDDQNWKIIKSGNVTFNENVVYKNDSSIESASIESEAEKLEFINLDGIPKGVAQKRNSKTEEDQQVEDTTDQQTEQGTPTVVVRRFLKNIRPPQRYSPSLFHILLTDGGIPSW
jgi:transposase InsO family protein